jgi:hypothetical protein
MPAYRLYCIDGLGHVADLPEWIAADTDEEAIKLSSEMKHRLPCELWDRKRLVAKIPAHR